MLCSVVELADLPDVAMDLVFAEVKKRTGGAAHYDFRHISRIFAALVLKLPANKWSFSVARSISWRYSSNRAMDYL
jgi:hypothetical protein